MNLGNCLLQLGRLEEAELAFQGAAGLNPALVQAQFNLGLVRKRLGRWSESVMPLRAAHALAPQEPKTWDHLFASLMTLRRVGLGYLRLGQPAPQLSGGEAQRLKIARELSARGAGPSLYILDEPTVGLHFADVQRLLDVLGDLVGRGDTVIVVEHNLDVIRNSDWIVDLGPDGGDAGGELVAEGPPEVIAAAERSWTGKFLRGTAPSS